MAEVVIIVAIGAIGKGNVIGKNGELPWHLPEDLKHFKELTTNHTVIMGRKTFESIPEKFRPLPNRRNIVVTSNKDYTNEGIEVSASLNEAVGKVQEGKAFIIGGARLYEEALTIADTLEITKVEGDYSGDVFFPEIDLSKWDEISSDKRDGFTFLTLKRKS